MSASKDSSIHETIISGGEYPDVFYRKAALRERLDVLTLKLITSD